MCQASTNLYKNRRNTFQDIINYMLLAHLFRGRFLVNIRKFIKNKLLHIDTSSAEIYLYYQLIMCYFITGMRLALLVGLRMRRLYLLQNDKTFQKKKNRGDVLSRTRNCISWSSSRSEDVKSVYPFIAITPRSSLSHSLNSIQGKSRDIFRRKWNNRRKILTTNSHSRSYLSLAV